MRTCRWEREIRFRISLFSRDVQGNGGGKEQRGNTCAGSMPQDKKQPVRRTCGIHFKVSLFNSRKLCCSLIDQDKYISQRGRDKSAVNFPSGYFRLTRNWPSISLFLRLKKKNPWWKIGVIRIRKLASQFQEGYAYLFDFHQKVNILTSKLQDGGVLEKT